MTRCVAKQVGPEVVCLCFLLLAGCGRSIDIRAERPTAPKSVPRGTLAVLKVTARPIEKPKSIKAVLGKMQCPSAARTFAELAAHVASEYGWERVLTPAEVRDRLETQGLEPTLEPDPEELRRFAAALGCSSYLAAHIRQWRTSYFLAFARAHIEFSLSCYDASIAEPAWQADVTASGTNMSDREIALYALRETLARLREAAP